MLAEPCRGVLTKCSRWISNSGASKCQIGYLGLMLNRRPEPVQRAVRHALRA